jgi:hypothetical protein
MNVLGAIIEFRRNQYKKLRSELFSGVCLGFLRNINTVFEVVVDQSVPKPKTQYYYGGGLVRLSDYDSLAAECGVARLGRQNL